MKPTKLLTAVLIGGSLLAAAPAFADPGYGRHGDRYERHDRYDRYDRYDRHDRRVVVRRPVVVYQQPARVYYAPAPRPAPVAYYGYASPNGAGIVAGALIGAVIVSQLVSGR